MEFFCGMPSEAAGPVSEATTPIWMVCASAPRAPKAVTKTAALANSSALLNPDISTFPSR